MMNKICRMALPLIVFPSLVFAQAAGTPPNGRLLASNCFQCHGTDGKAVSGFEKLSGMSASELRQEMAEMKRKTGGIMNAHAAAYTDTQITAIAAYFSSIRNTTGTATSSSRSTNPSSANTTTNTSSSNTSARRSSTRTEREERE